jgi:hypothetical protein
MEENDQTLDDADAEHGVEDEIALTGDDAIAQWRKVRLLFIVAFLTSIGGPAAAYQFWDRFIEQPIWMGFGITALFLAVLVWKHGLMAFAYNKAGDSAVFVGKRPPVPREIATPALLIAAVLLFLASTSTGVGRKLSSIFSSIKVLYEAGKNVVGLLGSVAAIILMLIFAAIGLTVVSIGIFYLVRFVVRGFRPDPEVGSGLPAFVVGVVALAVLVFFAYVIVRYHDQTLDMAFEPFRTIWGWFH